MTKLAALLGSVAVALAACGGGGASTPAASDSAPPAVRCYELVEGSSRAVIKVEAAPSSNDAQGGQVTVYFDLKTRKTEKLLDGVEEFTPETTAGRLEPDAFVYADGTRLSLTDASLTWPQDSLLEGAVFTATSCP